LDALYIGCHSALKTLDASAEDLRADYDLLSLRGRLVVYGSHHIISRRGGIIAVPGIILRYITLPRFNPLMLTNDNKSIMGFNLIYLFHESDLLASSIEVVPVFRTDGEERVPLL
jgi:hypothetical protein